MTTIVYRDGIMAADSRAYRGDSIMIGTKVKLHRICSGRRAGTLFGCTSRDVGIGDVVFRWFAGGMQGGTERLKDRLALISEPGFAALAVHRDGSATFINGTGLPTRVKAPFYAIGSGEQYAFGALASGKSAVDAVLIACQFDRLSAPPVYVATHDKNPKDYGPLRSSSEI